MIVGAGLTGLGAIAWPAVAATDRPTLDAWRAQHPVVRFAPEREYGPFVFVDGDGSVRGLSVDMLDRLRRRADLQIETLPARPLHEQLAAAQAGQADLLSSLRPTPERSAFLLFTAPYAQVPAIVVVREGARTRDLSALSGRPVAVGRGYAVEAHVRRHWPALHWQAVDDDVQALQGVADGRYDAAVADAASVTFIAQRYALDGLTAAGEVGFDYGLSFAVRRDWPELRDLLDDGIRALGPAERQAVLQRWLAPLGPRQLVPRAATATRVALGALALVLVLGGLLWWRRGGPWGRGAAGPAGGGRTGA